MLEKFRENDLEYITLMLIAGLAATIAFLLIDPWFAICCFVASVVLALLMWAASIVLDIRDDRHKRHGHPDPSDD